MAKKKNKISTGDAVKILANESKQTQNNLSILWQNIQRIDAMTKDVMALFEHYIEHTKDGKSFVKKMEKLVEERLSEQKANEQANGQNPDGNKQDKGVRAEGVRAQEG